MSETTWDKTKKYSGTAYSKALKPGFDKAWKAMDKLGAPVNRLSNKVGAEAFWPTTMDKESDKAARILRAFCKDGFYTQIDEKEAEQAERTGEKVEGPKGKQRVLQKIPEKVIRRAKGLAIFTTMRTGLWVSGAGGSGVLVARNEETGEWSPPSGILLHTAGLGFLVGVDIYDCVVVINTHKALEAFMKIRCTLGGEVSAVAGPVGIGGVLETELHKRQAPVYNYMKSRGFYAGVQIDGTVIIERTDENERFYGERIPVADILAGKVRRPPNDKIRMLMDTIHAAQGDQVDEAALPDAPAPSDMDIEAEGSTTFGIPSSEDPDPYGVKALESEGLQIREAGTHTRPSQDAFEFKPATTSPIYATFRKSMDNSPLNKSSRPDSWRGSMHSVTSVNKGTQTDDDDSSPSPQRRGRGSLDKRTSASAPNTTASPEKIAQHVNGSDEGLAMDGTRRKKPDPTSPSSLKDEEGDAEVDVDEAEIHEATPVISKARVVQIPKRIPPQLPPRNPGRMSNPSPLSETTAPLSAQIESLRHETEVNGVDEDETPRAEVAEPSPYRRSTPETTDMGSSESEAWKYHSSNIDVNPNENHDDRQNARTLPAVPNLNSSSAESKDQSESAASLHLSRPSEPQSQPQPQSQLNEDDEFHSIPVTPVESFDHHHSKQMHVQQVPGAFN